MTESEPADKPETETESTRVVRRLEKREKYTLPVLVALLSLDGLSGLRKKLEVGASFWARICRDSVKTAHVSLPKAAYQKAINLCAELDPPVKFTLEDFQLPKEKLIERIDTDHPRYEAARAAAGLSSLQSKAAQQSNTFQVLSLLPGNYARFLIAKTDEEFLNLTVENFEIHFDHANPGNLLISQIDYEFENRHPAGAVQVVSRSDVIEIRIDYESDRDPMGTFLAPFPSEHPVTHILAIALDIHYNTRNVLAKPVLFMKQEKLYDKKDRFEFSEPIFELVQQLFKEFVVYDRSRMELSLPRISPAAKIREIQKELERIRDDTTDGSDRTAP